MRSAGLLAPIVALFLFTAGLAEAADPVPSLDLRGFRAPTDAESGVYVEPTRSRSTGEFSVGLWSTYSLEPITLRSARTGSVAFDVLNHQITGDVTASVGLFHRLELGLDLPVLLYQTGDEPTAASTHVLGKYTPSAQAVGDLALDAKLTLVRNDEDGPGGFGLALSERVTMPTGSKRSFISEAGATVESRLLGEYAWHAWGIHAALGYKLRGEHGTFGCESVLEKACDARFGDEIPFGLGVSLKPQALVSELPGRVTLFLEAHGHVAASPDVAFKDQAASSAQLDLATRIQVHKDISILGSFETALTHGVGDAPARIFLSVAWSPRSHDADGDGIPDEVDLCPNLAEDFDGFQDHDGCPEADNDNDGIPDAVDKCPNEPEDFDGFQDTDGCPDPDNDGDGIPDWKDACPNVAGPANPDPAKNGCPAAGK